MLVLYIIILMFTNSINQLQKHIHSIFINRITIITLLVSILFTFNTLYFQSIGKGISIYSGLFQTTVQSHSVEILLLIVGSIILMAWPYFSQASLPSSKGRARDNLAISDLAGLALEEPAAERYNKSGPRMLVSLSCASDKKISFASQADQYSLIAIFSILGGSLLMSSLDLLSMYLSIELQSFALYILATLNKEKLSATSAGLKYFLLGSLSSCFILLGSAIIYSYTGLTQFEVINTLLSCTSDNGLLTQVTNIACPINEEPLTAMLFTEGPLGLQSNLAGIAQVTDHINKAFTIGLIIILIGFLFKISAAPFYQWAPDVYDGTPTIVTVWLTIVVKLTIFIFLLGLIEFTLPSSTDTFSSAVVPSIVEQLNNWFTESNYVSASLEGGTASWASDKIKNLLLISSLLSLLIGTIAGLSQIKIKRLLAFSSISHVGFLLLALGIYSQNSVDSFIFYLVQYSVTSLNIFLIILALGYCVSATTVSDNLGVYADQRVASLASTSQDYSFVAQAAQGQDINYLIELKGQLYKNPVLSISLAICLLSMAGIPPLIGFFSKQFVLFSSIENGNHFLSIVAIIVSVISASYYLKLIKITFFETPSVVAEQASLEMTSSETNWRLRETKLHGYGSFANQKEEEVDLASDYITSLAQADKSSANTSNPNKGTALLTQAKGGLTNFHSYSIAILTFLILFFFLDPSILLNGTQLISLTIFNL